MKLLLILALWRPVLVLSAAPLTGRFVLVGANCAGFEFKNDGTALWYDELQCQAPTTMRIKWVDEKTFAAIDTERRNESCPPRVWLYSIVRRKKDNLILKDFGTGWGDLKDANLEFTRRRDK